MSAKILVVDNSAACQLTIKNMLSDYNILTASNDFEAMHQINTNIDIDLIILDLNMLKMNGDFEFLNTLKSDKRYKNIHTIILSNYVDYENDIKTLELKSVDYIQKPVNIEYLKSRINIHLQSLRVQKLYEEMILSSDMTLDTILNQVPVGIAISHSNEPFDYGSNNLSIINPVFEQITGRLKEELQQSGWNNITHPEDLDKDIENFNKLQSGKINSYSLEKRFIKPDGSIVWVDMIVAQLNLKNDFTYNYISIVQDITERKTMEKILNESERSKSVLLANIPGMAYRCNLDRYWTMQFVSQGTYDLTGYESYNLVNNKDLSFNDLIVPEYRKVLWERWKDIISKKLPFKYEYEIITATGQRKWVLEMGQGIYDENGNAEALEGIIIDISDRKTHEIENKHLSEHDTLTGLYNRKYFEELLAHDNKTKSYNKRAIINVNLSKIDLLTISYGFHYSQELIKKIAEVLSSYCTANCQLFSTHTNRFTFYLKEYHDKDELIIFSNTIVDILKSFLIVEGIGVGLGILEIDNNEFDVDQILKNVLIASENALNKPNRYYNYTFFDKDMELKILRKMKIKNLLEQIANGDDSNIYMQFQPIVDIKLNCIYSFEALARIKSDESDIISPVEFIPIAEETKLIFPVGKRIIYHSLSFLNKLKAKGYDFVNISINVSAIQLLKDDFNSYLLEILDNMGIEPGNLTIEITESMFSDQYFEINNKIGELKDSGIKIAIDDFGTGYSSFSRIRELKVNSLKIDKSFINKLKYLKPEQSITSDIISMAHKLGHHVVAEGVEYEVQKQYLLEHGCDMIQGYLTSIPLDEEAAIDLLDKKNCNDK